MTVLDDRITMPETSDEITLDMLFEGVAKMRIPEGYKVEIVEGAIYMSPQRDTHWEIIRRIVRALEDGIGMDAKIMSDVRIDFPGEGNGFAPDVAKLRDGAKKTAEGRWRPEDVEFVAEVLSEKTAANDHGPKKAAYAVAGVPVYLIVDPYKGEWHLHTLPKDDGYHGHVKLGFGDEVDLTATSLGLTLATDQFPRD